MTQLALVVGIGAVAGAVAWFLQRRDRPEPERGRVVDGPRAGRPERLRPARRAVAGGAVLVVHLPGVPGHRRQGRASWRPTSVAVQEIDSIERKDLHDRYGIDAVPLLLVVDDGGTVRRHFIGEPTATDLWAALAELREPGTVPPSCTHDG